MGPVTEWLHDMDVNAFRSSYLGRRPFACPESGRATVSVCAWSSLDPLLAASPDVLVVAKGEALPLEAPRSLAGLGRLFARGAGIVIRHPERQCMAIRELTRAVAQEIPGEQRVLVFATPEATHGFGWHYDPEDVFIVQTAGDKEYYFRENTIVPALLPYGQPDFSAHRNERSPVMSCRLWVGDFLYIPRGWWHVAYAHTASLSLSIGIFPTFKRVEPCAQPSPG
jgi:hypothetical protein